MLIATKDRKLWRVLTVIAPKREIYLLSSNCLTLSSNYWQFIDWLGMCEWDIFLMNRGSWIATISFNVYKHCIVTIVLQWLLSPFKVVLNFPLLSQVCSISLLDRRNWFFTFQRHKCEENNRCLYWNLNSFRFLHCRSYFKKVKCTCLSDT